MAVQILSLKCPECNATLNIEGDRTYAFCTYCGTKILLNNENEKIYRHIDEAEIKQAETDRIIRLKQLEIAEKKRAEKKVEKKAQRNNFTLSARSSNPYDASQQNTGRRF